MWGLSADERDHGKCPILEVLDVLNAAYIGEPLALP